LLPVPFSQHQGMRLDNPSGETLITIADRVGHSRFGRGKKGVDASDKITNSLCESIAGSTAART
jgi:hypothetical protein